ncbi:hypothetical protein COOONC_18280 [Cooperia oncophora]
MDDLVSINVSSESCTRVKGAEALSIIGPYTGGSYVWSVEMQGYIVGAAFLGGMLSIFPSGMAIDHFSMRHLLLASVLLLSSVSVLVPIWAEHLGPVAVIVLRFLMGVGEVSSALNVSVHKSTDLTVLRHRIVSLKQA